MTRRITDKLVVEYLGRRELYRDFSLTVKSLIGQLLTEGGYKFQILSSREKDPKKFDEKIKRKKKEGKVYKILSDIEDLSGVRVVFYLESQKDSFLEAIKKEFGEKSLRVLPVTKPGGYRAIHCIFTLDSAREKLSEYRRFKDLKCEIQITSSLYHAWSEIEHDITYKPDGSREVLSELGLDDLKVDLEKTITNYIVPAVTRFEQHNTLYQAIRKGADIFDQVYSVDKILSSSSNDQIFGLLEIIENFPHKKPDEIATIIQAVISKKPSRATVIDRFGGTSFFGKTHKDVLVKSIELIRSVRYFSTEKILIILSDLIKHPDKEIKEKATDALKAVSRFDYNLLTKRKAGYSYQRIALDFIKKWSREERFLNFEFVCVVVRELLSSSIEGSSWTDEKTLTMHFAHVQPTDFLKKIRRESMNFVYELYMHSSDSKVRLELSSVLEEALRGPGNVAYSDELRKMLDDDAEYLAKIYRKMIFDKSGNLIRENIAVSEEVEERMYYFAKPEKGHAVALGRLREDILNDTFYQKVQPMIGGRAAYRGEEGYEESKQKREKDQKDTAAQISDENFGEWHEILNVLAEQKEVIEEWKLGDLKRFFEVLSSERPDVADRILSSAFKKKEALVRFSENFLMGFRSAGRLDIWDKYVECIAKKKDARLIGGICWSLGAYKENQTPEKLRSVDMNILEDIVFKRGRFSFLKTKKRDDGTWYLHDRLFHTLAFNFSHQPWRVENLFKEEMRNNSEYAQIHYHGLQFVSTAWKWLDLSLVSYAFKKFLLKKVIEAPGVDWHLQGFLMALCSKDFDCVMDVFKQRIARTVALQRKDRSRGVKRLMKRKEFEAIPDHFNPDLQKLLTEDSSRFSSILKIWMSKMTLGWSTYNWEISRFLEELKVNKRDVLSDIVALGNDKDLLRAAYAIEGINKADFNLCMQIVGRTDNERILSKIQSIMCATGVVSGEYGIADAYKGKIEMLQKYKNSKNKRIRNFAKKMIGYLEKSESDERKRTAEEIQLHKIRFEGAG